MTLSAASLGFIDFFQLIRPVNSFTEPVLVTLSLEITQILDVDEKNQVIAVECWLRQQWRDVHLQWNPEQYKKIEQLHIPEELIWKPDIVMFQNADGNFTGQFETKAILSANGQVNWEVPMIFRSSCKIDVTYFPYDTQNCSLTFGSWTYDKEGNGIKIYYFVDERAFFTLQIRLIITVVKWHNHELTQFDVFDHPDIQFRLVMRRYPLFYNVFLITPCLLISFLTALVYYLPCSSHQKITFCTSVLLAHTFYLMVIAEIIPSTGDTIPLIAEYLLLNMIFITLSIVITTLNIHYRSPSSHPPLPVWMRHFFLRLLPRVLCVSPPNDELGMLLAKHECQLTLHLLINGLPESENIIRDQARRLARADHIPEEFVQTASDIDDISQKYKDEIRNQTEISEWRFVAILMDRIFLYLFLLVSLFGIVVLFLPAWVDYSSKANK
ncbi:unnamed protein product [Oikopleura dioica]|uniref:Uncharacterized protein n=1 Tax=Oikopleura dioica TaxID=34765 RepID=E4X6Y8_OIKDI|nr:unnamed protein product [Oikopleura dioica]